MRSFVRSKSIAIGVVRFAVVASMPLSTAPVFAQTSDTSVQNTQDTQKKPTFTLPAGLDGNSGGNGSDSGNKASGVQMLTAGASIAMAGYLATQCGPKNPMACAMAAMAASQAASLFGNSQGSKAASSGMSTYDPSSGLWTNTGTNGTPTTTGLNPTTYDNPATTQSTSTNPTTSSVPTVSQSALDQLKGINSKLENMGYKVSKDGSSVILPDGRQISGAAMGSADGMAAAGMSPSEISAAQAALKAAQEKAASKIKLASLGADGGGGGGGGGGAGGRDPAGGGGAGMENMFGKMPWDKEKKKEEKNRVSGMSKKLGNDNIGVAGDNIFEMVTRRYKARDAANTFLK